LAWPASLASLFKHFLPIIAYWWHRMFGVCNGRNVLTLWCLKVYCH
jgi:hypothetical protein